MRPERFPPVWNAARTWGSLESKSHGTVRGEANFEVLTGNALILHT